MHYAVLELLGDVSIRQSTRERLIDTALMMFMKHGFNSVGLDRILNEVGVTKTTFYNHFESKEQLAIDSLHRRVELDRLIFTQFIVESVGPDPCQQMLAIFDVLDAYFNDERFVGCIFIKACAEFPEPSDPIHRVASGFFAWLGQHIQGLATQAEHPDPKGLAQTWVMLIQGAISQRLILTDPHAAKRAKVLAEGVLGGSA